MQSEPNYCNELGAQLLIESKLELLPSKSRGKLFEEAQERISPELGYIFCQKDKETNEICIGQVRFPVWHSQTPDLTKFIFGPQHIHVY